MDIERQFRQSCVSAPKTAYLHIGFDRRSACLETSRSDASVVITGLATLNISNFDELNLAGCSGLRIDDVGSSGKPYEVFSN